MNRCYGCGAILQTQDKEKIGYIPKDKKNDAKLCLRCFRILHYNDLKMVELPTEDILNTVNKKGEYAFFLMDFLNINEEVVSIYKKISIPKTLIISKIDYIPKYVNKNKIKDWLKKEYGVEEEILFASAVKNINLGAIRNTLDSNKKRCAYLLGFTNSGKSTLLNHLQENSTITTSLVPNTTLDYIKIPISEKQYLIDSPGFQYQNPIYKENMVLLKKMNPKTFLKPITYQLKKDGSILIENILRIENESEKCNMTLYMSNLLSIKRVYKKNKTGKEFSSKKIKMKKNQDLVIKGLGFINIKNDCSINLYMENQNRVEIRNSFFER